MFYQNKKGRKAPYIHASAPPNGLMEKLPSGAYEFERGDMMSPTKFAPMEMHQEHVVEMETKAFQRVMNVTRQFFDPNVKAKAKRYGVPHRLGILMYGPQGTGKSVLVRKVVRELTEPNDAVTVVSEIGGERDAVQLAREGAPNRPIILIWEEFEENARHVTAYIKDLMDGMNSPRNVLYLATTNHLDHIPDALVRRPGRFAHVLEVGYFDREEREKFASQLLDFWKVTPEDRATLDFEGVLAATEGKSADDIKSILLNALIYGLPVSVTLEDMAEVERNKSQQADAELTPSQRLQRIQEQLKAEREEVEREPAF